DFDKAEPLAEQRVGHFAVLVETRSHSDRVGKGQPGDGGLERSAKGGRTTGHRPQRREGQTMHPFGIEREQRGPGEAVEHGPPMAARPQTVDASRPERPAKMTFIVRCRNMSLSYKHKPPMRANGTSRPEGLEAAMRRVLDFQGRLRIPEPPLFCGHENCGLETCTCLKSGGRAPKCHKSERIAPI